MYDCLKRTIPSRKSSIKALAMHEETFFTSRQRSATKEEVINTEYPTTHY